jgi:hypothetical protein
MQQDSSVQGVPAQRDSGTQSFRQRAKNPSSEGVLDRVHAALEGD